MHVPDSAEAADRIDLVVTACHDVAEVQHGADRRLPSAAYSISDRSTVAHSRRECGASTSRFGLTNRRPR